MKDNENTAEAFRYITEATDLNAWDVTERAVIAGIAQAFASLAVADELKTANLLSYYATTGTSIYNERQRAELTGRLGIPETPIVPLNREHETTQSLGGLPTKAEVEAEIEACAQDLWKADPGNNTPARTFNDDYASAQDRYRAMARAALGLHDEPKKEK